MYYIVFVFIIVTDISRTLVYEINPFIPLPKFFKVHFYKIKPTFYLFYQMLAIVGGYYYSRAVL